MNTDYIQIYPTPAGFLRMVRFTHENGETLSLNYAYMVSVRYIPTSSTVEVAFTTHHITIRGFKLKAVFDLIEAQQAQNISCVNERYEKTGDESQSTVIEIISTPYIS